MVHGRGRIVVRGEDVMVSIERCFVCRGRGRKERLLLAACVIFMAIAAVEFLLLLLAGGLG